MPKEIAYSIPNQINNIKKRFAGKGQSLHVCQLILWLNELSDFKVSSARIYGVCMYW